MAVTDEERLAALRRSLTNHRPTPEAIQAIEALRSEAMRFGGTILRSVPNGRERALALTGLEESVMWAVKGMALASGTPEPFDG